MLPVTKNTRKQVSRNAQGVEDINDRGDPVFRRVSKPAVTSSSGGLAVRRAITTQNAQGVSTITANLLSVVDGSIEEAITVTCNISNGIELNSAVPRLELGDILMIASSKTDAQTTVWYCLGNFHASEDCVCS